MAGFWVEADEAVSFSILKKIEEDCFERFDTEKTRVYSLSANPYPNAKVYRLVFRNQWARNIKDQSRKFAVPGGAISHVILTDPTHPRHPDMIFCLGNKGDSVHKINHALDLKITRGAVIGYVVFFGQVVQADHGSFNFITDRTQFATLSEQEIEISRNLAAAIEALFKVDSDHAYELNLREKHYPIIGSAFLLDVPTVYSGTLFSTDLRLSERGYITMDQDDPTAVDGVDQLMPPTQYYPIDNSPAALTVLSSASRSLHRPIVLFAITQFFEKILGVLSFPVFALLVLMVVIYGTNNDVVFSFLELLSSTNFFSWLALFIGTGMVVGSVLRFFVIELGRLTSSLVPNRLTAIFDATKMRQVAARGKIGFIWFLLITTLEFAVIPIQAATIFCYGAINTLSSSGEANFFEAAGLVATSIPLVPLLLTEFYSFSGIFGLYEIPSQPILSWGVSVFFTSVIVGVLFRLILLSRQDNQ